jgi:hypothetical protein
MIGVSWRQGPHHGAQSRSAPAGVSTDDVLYERLGGRLLDQIGRHLGAGTLPCSTIVTGILA